MYVALAIFMILVYSSKASSLQAVNKKNLNISEENLLPTWIGRSEKRGLNYTSMYAVELTQEGELQALQNHSAFVFLGKIFDDESLYLFGFNGKGIPVHFTQGKWIRQDLFERKQRTLKLDSSIVYESNFLGPRYRQSGFKSLLFNDPLYKDQWYLHRSERFETPRHQTDINVLPVWKAGITGTGVRISVLDDGVCKRNPEVAKNYDREISFDYVNFKYEIEDDNEIPQNSHGTYCAAIAAGAANNEYCGIGVAFDARVGGVRILDGLVSDAQEAMGLTNALDLVDIYVASWGPKDDGRHVGGPGTLTKRAFRKGVTKGRGGKGSIYVWAAGNGGGNHDNCNLDGYASSPYTLTFGALTTEGLSTFYSEPCSAILASTFVGGLHKPPDEAHMEAYKRMIKVIVPDGCGKCRVNFQGTSAAAPIASGVIALMLDANPSLTWRDVQHIIVETAKIPNPQETGWYWNAAGRHFHPKVGFGSLDAASGVRLAVKWKAVGELLVRSSKPYVRKRFIKPSMSTVIAVTYEDENLGKSVAIIESVVVRLNIRHPVCGTFQIYLISPSGTTSLLLSRRPLDNITTSLHNWDLVSLHFWGENPVGKWVMRIVDERPLGSIAGFVNYFRLTFFGTHAS